MLAGTDRVIEHVFVLQEPCDSDSVTSTL
jgi:hypothetical protein